MKTTEKSTNSHAFSRAIRYFVSVGFLPLLALIVTMPTSHAGIEAIRITTGLTEPLYVCAPPGDTSRLFVAEQGGKIKIINLPSGTVNPAPFLDITFEVAQNQGGGVLGMTFDPNYAVNGRFYVSYTIDRGGVFGFGVSHIARFNVSPDPNIADLGSDSDGAYCRSTPDRS
jgi:glucose/arabinose dehydrogenase